MQYKNSFYENDKRFRSEYLTCDTRPIEYKSYQIFHRLSDVYDIVKDGVCIGMRGSIDNCKQRIDELTENKQLTLF